MLYGVDFHINALAPVRNDVFRTGDSQVASKVMASRLQLHARP